MLTYIRWPETTSVDMDDYLMNRSRSPQCSQQGGSHLHKRIPCTKDGQEQDSATDATSQIHDDPRDAFGHIQKLMRAYASCGTLGSTTIPPCADMSCLHQRV